jgi:hypothetical protein
MRRFLLMLFCFSVQVLFSQSTTTLKKKYMGTYFGELPAFTYTQGLEQVPVAACSIRISLGNKELIMQIGNQRYRGVWRLLYQTEAYFVLEGNLPGRIVSEQLRLLKQNKVLVREGILNQPDALLNMVE